LKRLLYWLPIAVLYLAACVVCAIAWLKGEDWPDHPWAR